MHDAGPHGTAGMPTDWCKVALLGGGPCAATRPGGGGGFLRRSVMAVCGRSAGPTYEMSACQGTLWWSVPPPGRQVAR